LSDWQHFLQSAIRSLPELLEQLSLSTQQLPHGLMHPDFPLRVPRPFMERMKKGDPTDPLLRQVLATHEELQITPGYASDPLAEKQHNPVPGLLHKYHGRVLITATGHCAVHCRYCFRRVFPYQDNNPGQQGWKKIIQYIHERKEIKEVILSGGDPLSASDYLVAQWMGYIESIPHVRILRIHSRLPIVIPQRVTTALLRHCKNASLRIVLVIHCNHPQELDDSVQTALVALTHAGVTLLNQSVLLKNINDDANTLVALSQRLFECGVMPYYLHCLDPVQGTAHFALHPQRITEIMTAVMSQLPGYLVPKCVQEQAFAPHKVPIILTHQ
jgi:L-lysine 2,3-aminomutase